MLTQVPQDSTSEVSYAGDDDDETIIMVSIKMELGDPVMKTMMDDGTITPDRLAGLEVVAICA